MDKKRYDAGAELLKAAHNFWKACQEENQPGAVQWLEGTDGELIIFTRMEYKKEILDNIFKFSFETGTHTFAEKLTPKRGSK